MTRRIAEGQPSLPLKSTAFLTSIDLSTTETDGGRSPFPMESEVYGALARVGMTMKQLAAHCEINESQLGKAVRGVEGHVPFGKLLDKAPDEFWCELLPAIAARYGLSVVGGHGLGQSIARLLYVAADVVSRLDAREADRKVG